MASMNAQDTIEIQTEAEGPISTAYEMRITNHGKIQAWVTFALDFLQVSDERLSANAVSADPDSNRTTRTDP